MTIINRRRQFGKVDDRPRVYHPDWYYTKLYIQNDNGSAFVLSSGSTPVIKQVVSTPEGGELTAVEKGFKGTKAGFYEVYYTKPTGRYIRGAYSLNFIIDVRLPRNYYTEYDTELYGWSGGGTARNQIKFYFLHKNPIPNMITEWPATNAGKAWIHLYVPKGSLQAYANYNSTWQTIYNEGRLHEWEFKIIED